jgi:hypothetical protein
MTGRILTLLFYHLRGLAVSLAGFLFLLVTLVFWRVFLDPTQQTPDIGYYLLATTLFGAGLSFLVTLSISARAHRALNHPLLVRMPSRVEYLTGVFMAAIFFATLLQALLGVLALWNGPAFTLAQLSEVPPVWLGVNILAVVLALHASDLVVHGWSRVYVFGITAVLLFLNNLSNNNVNILANGLSRLSTLFYTQNWSGLGNFFNNAANRLSNNGLSLVERLTNLIFWPFHAISEAIVAGGYTPRQALAPGVLLLYATLLFLLAATFYAQKDLFMTE